MEWRKRGKTALSLSLSPTPLSGSPKKGCVCQCKWEETACVHQWGQFRSNESRIPIRKQEGGNQCALHGWVKSTHGRQDRLFSCDEKGLVVSFTLYIIADFISPKAVFLLCKKCYSRCSTCIMMRWMRRSSYHIVSIKERITLSTPFIKNLLLFKHNSSITLGAFSSQLPRSWYIPYTSTGEQPSRMLGWMHSRTHPSPHQKYR